MKTSIYLPDDLAEQVRAFRIPMSEVAQAALRQAVADAEALAQAKAQIGPDVQAAVTRLSGILADEERTREEVRATGRTVGVLWARDYATPHELKEMAGSYPPTRVRRLHSLFRLCEDEPELTQPITRGKHLAYVNVSSPWWAGFCQGAVAVWEAVRPILEHQMQPTTVTAPALADQRSDAPARSKATGQQSKM
jgi:post-segregation antitoxin (ccd killing protein)